MLYKRGMIKHVSGKESGTGFNRTVHSWYRETLKKKKEREGGIFMEAYPWINVRIKGDIPEYMIGLNKWLVVLLLFLIRY